MQKKLRPLFGKSHGLDAKSVDFLTKALEKNNLPGFDYIEFKQSLGALQAMNLDEETAMKSAFATASTVGLTKKKLLDTADHYRKILANEKTQFDAALQKQVQQRVKSKQVEAEKLKTQINEYKEKMKLLEEKMAKAQSTIDHADEYIRTAVGKIEKTKENFETTHQSILNQIERDISSIKNYL
ncbi:MAG: hypothetical protein GY705_05625 [Bacteroidetes bacterium]|nr:hypothetical protein [Bacteroidota bacterium]